MKPLSKITLKMIFLVNPQPAKRMTSGQVKLMRIPDKVLRYDQLLVKARIKRYLEYKDRLTLIGTVKKFTLPESDFHIKFFIETDKKSRWGNPHKMKPDTDNLVKALKDALCKNDAH